ncbi:MAG: hypothetical protein WCD31_12785 [Gillisia sp.]
MKNPILYYLFLVILICPMLSFGQQHQMKKSPLTMPGNEIFGTIQEVVYELEKDSTTDWSQVNIEALRQHLLDMKAFTEEVEVISQTPVENGTQILVKPQSPRADEALKRLFKMHPMMLKKEKNWDMEVTPQGDSYLITVTTPAKEEVPKVRALGYIGILAEGAHHQTHHWMIATGQMHMN